MGDTAIVPRPIKPPFLCIGSCVANLLRSHRPTTISRSHSARRLDKLTSVTPSANCVRCPRQQGLRSVEAGITSIGRGWYTGVSD